MTGDDLIAFINNDEAVRPDGSRTASLLHCAACQSESGDNRRSVVANVFRRVVNRMINGYILRNMLNLVNGIHFNSSEEIRTLGRVRDAAPRVRDAAGDSGELYTPRPWCGTDGGGDRPKTGRKCARPSLWHGWLSGRSL